MRAALTPSTFYDARGRTSARGERDEELKADIARVHAANYGVYGARKVWLALNREGIGVARCTVERLMRELGLEGVRRGKQRRTTIANPAAPRPADLVERRFSPVCPDAVWVADFTYVATWSGTVYVAFVLDAHSRRILGWRASTSMRTELVLDAPEQALWTRGREGVEDLSGLVCHHDAGSQYTSIAFTEQLATAGAAPSVGSVGDALDNALAETHIGLFKFELIRCRGPWHGPDDVELATLEGVDWHNNRRLHTACHDLTPVEYPVLGWCLLVAPGRPLPQVGSVPTGCVDGQILQEGIEQSVERIEGHPGHPGECGDGQPRQVLEHPVHHQLSGDHLGYKTKCMARR